MTGTQVDLFSKRLMDELGALSWRDRNELLIKIGKMEMRMRMTGQERPLWRGPAPVSDMLGADVVAPTEQGERRGRVICFGVMRMPDGIEYERSLVVLVPASGTCHEVPASVARLAERDDVERMRDEVEMARRLREATATTQEGPTPLEQAKRARRGAKDPALIKRMLDAAQAHPSVKNVEEALTNHKVVGINPERRIYIFKSGLRVDISGFSVDHPGVRKISEQEARDMHLGRVRGQVDFSDKVVAYDGLVAALGLLSEG